ncbi:ActS/PrrB/RegB family redox-sensitive histidine kinase [Futiania mangrovi]|uniref:histidine kinase n=1 Tax=Futiania mangrovi TaxID=2959716 RepID=A0A9J6PK66_9PROT|nr:ActS/PrrB/RegB family redox-sensitive histidine kinase [Futiania mangrovii]MCP1336466.1 ActS/PrrB/RegB family redox-sensitive histidine kinase [Futiania mangrovii]
MTAETARSRTEEPVPVTASGAAPALRTGDGGVRHRTLILLRWIAICGQLVAVLGVHFLLGFDLPLEACLAVIGAAVWINLTVRLWTPMTRRLTDGEATVSFAFDLLQLACLLYLTGGLTNPFALLFLAPVTVSASILSPRATALLGLVAGALITVLAAVYRPLPWTGPPPDLPPVYIGGIWAALIVSLAFTSLYAARLAREQRHMAAALATLQMALAREQRLAALGGLAAAAAHELGTPLATITIAARELARDIPAGDPLAEDVHLIAEQAARCRDILTRLARQPGGGEGAGPFARLPLPVLLEQAVAAHRVPDIDLELRFYADGERVDPNRADTPVLDCRPELIHALGNIVENAVAFARSRVVVEARWDGAGLTLQVRDDGPGFSPDVLQKLGEPYLTSRPRGRQGQNREGLGLGVFIAKTLLERTGARVTFFNARRGAGRGGAVVALFWSKSKLKSAHSSGHDWWPLTER